MQRNRIGFSLIALLFSSVAWAQGVPELLPFQGRLTDAGTGNPTNYTVQVKFRIYPPTGSCYLYEDSQAVTPNNYGMFSVLLGAPGNSSGPGNAFSTVFNNGASGIPDSCSSSYVPAANDWRRIEIVVDGTPMAQMQTIGASVYALNSKNSNSLGGKLASQFIQVTGGVTQANVQNLVNGSDAGSLHNHDSVYARVDGSNTYSGNIQTTSGIYTTSGSVGIGTTSASADLEINKAAPSVRLSATSGGGGVPKIDFYSGAATQRASIRSSESTNELRMFTGSTEAMRLDANQNAFFAGSMVVAGTVGLGRYTNAQETTLVSALTPQGTAATGTMWVNTTSGVIKYWDGSSAQVVMGGGGSLVSSVTAGTGITLSGTAADPVINLSPITLAGDVSGAVGATTVAKIRGTNVNISSLTQKDILQYDGTNWVNSAIPTCTAGQYLTYNGTAWICATDTAGSVTSVGISVPSYMSASGGPVTSSGTITLGFGSQTAATVFAAPSGAAGAPSFRLLNISDVQSSVAGAFLTGGGCSAGQALTYSSVTDAISCTGIIPSIANTATLASAKIWVGDGANKAQEVVISGDATMSNAGIMSLVNSGVTAGTYSKVTVDAKGRVTTGANIGSSDVTTALGFTPLNKAGDVMTGAFGLNAVASDPAGLGVGDKGKVWYNTTSSQVKYWDGSAAQPLGVAGSGLTSLNGETGTSQTFATGSTGTDFSVSSASGTHTFNLPSASGSARGLLTSSDWTTFNDKMASNTVFAGDVSGAYNALSVDKIKGKSVAPVAYSAGQTLRYDGTNWVNSTLSFSDVASKPTTLAGYGITDASSSTLADGKILVGNSSNVATAVTMSGDAALSNAGVLTLTSTAVSAGSYGSASAVPTYSVDSKGRMIASASVAYQNATAAAKGIVQVGSNIDVASGVISISSSGVTGALGFTPVNKAGDTMGGALNMGGYDIGATGNITMNASKYLGIGQYAADPSTAGWGAAEKGRTWFNTTTNTMKYWDGSSVQGIGVGALTAVTASAPLSSSGGTSPNISMAQANGSTDGYLSSTDWTTFNNKLGTGSAFAGDVSGTYNSTSVDKIKGKAIAPVAYSAGQTLRYDGTNWVNSALSFSDIASKPTTLSGYGITDAASSTLADGKILVGNGSNVATAVFLSGDASLSNAGVMTLVNSGVSGGTYGSSTAVPSFTVDAKGRLTVAGSAAYADATAVSKGIVQVGSNINVASGVISINAASISGALGYTPLNKSGDVMTGAFGLNAVASDPAGLGAGDKGKVWYNTTSSQVKYWDGSAAQSLGVAGSGLTSLNGETGSTQTFAAGSTGTDFAISSASGVHTFNLPSASGSARGLLTSADWTTFNNKLGTGTVFAGDISGAYNSLSVDKIKGKSVAPVAYSAGQTLRYDGTNWVNSVLSFSDIASKPTTLSGYGITDATSSTLADGKILVGNGSNVATAVLMSGDATLSNAGVLTLGNSGVTGGTYGSSTSVPSFTVDAKGRITAASSAAYADATTGAKGVVQVGANINISSGVISINAASISGALGYTALNKAGDVLTGSLGLNAVAADPSGLGTGDKGKVWYNTTSSQIKFWDGSAAQALGVAGSGLTSLNGETGSSQTFALGSSGTDASISSSSNTHTFNFPSASGSARGLLTSTDWTAFNNKLGTSTVFAGDVSGAYNSLSVDKIKGKAIAPVAYSAGQTLRYDGTNWVNSVLSFSDIGSKPTTLSGYGITDSLSTTLADGKILVGNGSNEATAVLMSGDATLSNAGVLTLSNTGVSGGTYGSSTGVPSITVDAKGRITTVGATAYADATAVSKGIVQVGSNINVASGVISINAASISGALGYTPLNKSGDVMTGAFGLNAVASDPAGLGAGDKGKVWYNTTSSQVKYWDGSAAQSLGVAGSGLTSLNGETGSSQTFATGSAGTDVSISSASGTHTFNLPSASGSARGLLTSSDWTAFNNKLGTSTVFAGDVSGAYNSLSVDKIKGQAVAPVAYSAGQTLRYDGTNWVNSTLSFSDLTSGTLPTSRLPALAGDISSSAGSNSITLNTVSIAKGGTGLTAGGTANQVLGMNNAAGALEYKTITAGSGVTVTHGANSITIAATGSGGTVTNVSGNAPISVTNGTSTPSISISQANGSTDGYLSSTDWNTFNGKLGTGTVFAGDVSGAYNSLSVDKIKGKSVSPVAYAAGQTLRYDGTNWVNSVLSFSDIASKPTTLSGYGITDAASSTLADGKILVGNGSNVATAVLMSGDATLSNAGDLTLSNSGVSGGTYGSATAVPSFTVDAKGRLTVAGSVAYADATAVSKGIVQVGSNINVASGVLSINATSISGALGFNPLNKAGDTMSGNLTAPGFFYSSDRRLKTDIQDIEGLEMILNLHGVRFKWKNNGNPEIGLIAQEVEAVLPELVKTDEKTGIKSVKYGNLVAPLIESTKELYSMYRGLASDHVSRKEYESLKNSFDSLKKENEEMKNELRQIKEMLMQRK